MERDRAKRSGWLGGGVDFLYELEVEGGLPQLEGEEIPDEFEVDMGGGMNCLPCSRSLYAGWNEVSTWHQSRGRGRYSRDCRSVPLYRHDQPGSPVT